MIVPGDAPHRHLTYCTNIHPGESWKEVFESLQTHTLPLKQQLAPGKPFGIGLRLSNEAAITLLEGDHLPRFRQWLDENGLYVFTLNGFPYGSFHRQVVKDNVYKPDWRTRERLDYTRRLVEILAALLPDGIDGGISTSPLSYKPWLIDEEDIHNAFEDSTAHLAELATELVQLHQSTGKLIHIDIEPEPDCLIENTQETIAFFNEWLFVQGSAQLAENLKLTTKQATDYLRDHIRLCYDTCHFAVEYEPAAIVLQDMRDAGIRIGKIQISAAVKVDLPNDAEAREKTAQRLTPFAESTYLHQVVEQRVDGSLHHYTDLLAALPSIQQSDATSWRVHFHVPIFIEDFGDIQSTQQDIVDALRAMPDYTDCTHLEFETYTWEVLPPELKLDLTTSIHREYEWVLSVLQGS